MGTRSRDELMSSRETAGEGAVHTTQHMLYDKSPNMSSKNLQTFLPINDSASIA